MKKQTKSQPKMTIAQFVLGRIKAEGLEKGGSKETLAPIVAEVKRKFSGTKFNLAHAHWYLSRYRRQKREGLGVDKLHQLKPGKKAAKVAKKGSTAKAKPKGKAKSSKAALVTNKTVVTA